MAIALFGSVILGIMASFLARVLDPRLRREEQLRSLFRLPILTRVPIGGTTRGAGPLAPNALTPGASEAYRTLRATLSGKLRAGDSASIFITGSVPSEGKTTSAINLASSFALAGDSVILIEGDLRLPAIGKALGVTAERGVVSVLIENSTLEDALVPAPTLGGNLRLLLADYSGPGNAAELFTLPSAARLIEDAKRLAKVVIIDSPPLAEIVDTLPLAVRADSVVVVARLGRSNVNRIKQLGELLAENGIRPAGFAVLGVPRPRADGYYYLQRNTPPANQNGTRRARRIFSGVRD
jgi:ATPases involved in chromosome partitioning